MSLKVFHSVSVKLNGQAVDAVDVRIQTECFNVTSFGDAAPAYVSGDTVIEATFRDYNDSVSKLLFDNMGAHTLKLEINGVERTVMATRFGKSMEGLEYPAYIDAAFHVVSQPLTNTTAVSAPELLPAVFDMDKSGEWLDEIVETLAKEFPRAISLSGVKK